MEIDEVVTRLTKHYWPLLLALIVGSVVVVGLMVSREPASYTAHARIAVSAEIPKSAAEASALVSQVQALATSRDVVAAALSAGRITHRDAQHIADHDVSVNGQGTSAIVGISVTDSNAKTASVIAARLASGVAAAFDHARIGNLPSVIARVDQQLDQLARKRAPIAAQLGTIAAENPHDARLPMLQSQLAGLDTLISDLSADRTRLAEQLAVAGHATVVDTPTVPSHTNTRGLAERMALAGLAGLIAGLILVALIETIRPTVSGPARLARLLSVPLLGKLNSDPATLQALAQRIRLAARQASVSHVVVTSTSGKPVPEWLLNRLRAVLLEPLHGPGGVRPEASPVHDVALVGARTQERVRRSAAATDANGHRDPAGEIRGVSAIDELTPAAETDHLGVLVLSGRSTTAKAIHEIRDLVDASGWPLLGVAALAKRG